ncbi:hypothetical protein BKA62DRAFT_827390 [Auriculariales sp. MPI-PUGE-AT-0066]|nr:hypothetical protein BKA62DRAFT_827390 [Auriculariales sp. MPI-PUGE-AT-0066]
MLRRLSCQCRSVPLRTFALLSFSAPSIRTAMAGNASASSSKTAILWPFGRRRRASAQGLSKCISAAVVAAPREPRPRTSRVDIRTSRPISLLPVPAPLLVPPTAPLPPLPVELWEVVFNMAVDEHVLRTFFATPKESPFTDRRVSDYQLEYVYLQSAATMRACARVNREWSERATPYLYRHVWVRCPVDADLLARTLAPTFRRSSRTLLLQKLVQNVLIRFPRDLIEPGQTSRSYARKLAAVVRNLPNLGVFLASDASLPEKVSRALSCARVLTRGEWSTSVHKAMVSSGALRGLKSLFLQCPGMSPGHVDPTPLVRVELPHLHTLSVAFCRHKALSAAASGKWHMPALKHLSVCRCSVLGASFGPSGVDTPQLLRRVGANLDQLDLNCAMAGVPLDLATTCPSLRTLLISALSLPRVRSHPALEVVGLHQPIGFAPPPAEMEALIELLDLVTQHHLFPRVHSVRYLIPAQTVKRLSAHPDSGLRAAMEGVVTAGIFLADVGCNPIKFSHASSVAPSDYDWDNMSIAY